MFRKRFIAALLTFCMVAALLPARVLAAADGYEYSDGVLRITALYALTNAEDATEHYADITSVEISANTAAIDFGIFSACAALRSFTVDAGNERYKAVDGVLYSLDYNDTVMLHTYPAGRAGPYIVPADVVGASGSAFNGCAGIEIYARSEEQLAAISKTKTIENLIASGALSAGSYQALTAVHLPGAKSMNIGDSQTAPAVTFSPSNASAASVYASDPTRLNARWESSEPSCVAVDGLTGEIRALAAGTSEITLSIDVDGVTYSTRPGCMVTVAKKDVEDLTLSAGALPEGAASGSNTLTLAEAGAAINMTATLTEGEPTERRITLLSTDPGVVELAGIDGAALPSDGAGDYVTATLNADRSASAANFQMKAKKAGTASIVAVSRDNGLLDYYTVTVRPLAAHICLDKTTITLGYGGTETLSATVLPADAANKSVGWRSGDGSVATVDGNGVVTANNAGVQGQTAITAYSLRDDAVLAVCTVTVQREAVTRVTLNKHSLEVYEGGSDSTLSYTLEPDSATNKRVTWDSLNPEIATVDQTGKVTGVKHGTAVITVTTEDNGYEAACAVTVKPVEATGITVAPSSLSFGPGNADPATLTATVTPNHATDKTVVWRSTNESVATVDGETGKVTPVAPGTAAIIAVAAGGDGVAPASCAVTVAENGITAFALSSTDFTEGTQNEIELTRSSSAEARATLTVSVTPEDLEYDAVDDGYRNVEWFSSDPAVVDIEAYTALSVSAGTVSQTATLKTAKAGTAHIVVRTEDGRKREICAVTVYDAVTGVSIGRDTLTLNKSSAPHTLIAAALPATADQAMNWASSDPYVATVDTAGVVTPLHDGTAVITAASGAAGADADKKASCTVTVRTMATGATLDRNSLTLNQAGDTGSLTVTGVLPEGATDKTVTWKSLNEAVATVANGTVTAVAPGTAAILATPADGGAPAVCNVTVLPPVAGVYLNKTAVTLGYGGTAALTATAWPADAADRSVSWSTSDGTVATVAGGVVTAGSKTGTATITVTTTDGSKTASCTVTVQPTAVAKLELPAALELLEGHSSAAGALTVTADPADAVFTSKTWSSSDTAVATIPAAGGAVKALKVGTAVITVEATHESGEKYTASCTVTVQPVRVTGVTLGGGENLKTAGGKKTLGMKPGDEETLTATVLPNDTGNTATNTDVTWLSTDESVATVDGETGKVKAIAPGTATIMAVTADGGKQDSCAVTVWTAVTGLRIHRDEITLDVNGTEALEAIVTPAGASDPGVTWSVSEASPAGAVTVSAAGVVTAVKGGTAKVIAKSADNAAITAECAVTVRTAATGVSMSGVDLDGDHAVSLLLGGAEAAKRTTLSATVLPAADTDDGRKATNRKVRWRSSDAGVAEVSVDAETGVATVTAQKAGAAVITVTAEDGGFTDSCTVTVWDAVTALNLNKETLTLTVGETEALLASIEPGTAVATGKADPGLSWQSSDTSKVTVVNGLVTAVAATGDTPVTITVKSTASEGYTKTCAVTVNAVEYRVDGIRLYRNGDASKAAVASLELAESGTQQLAAEVTSTKSGTPATDGAVEWYSTYPDVASVTVNAETGVATVAASADHPGTTTIIARTADGGKVATCNVTVKPSVTAVALSWGALTLGIGQTQALSVVVQPSDYSFGSSDVTWDSTDPTVATAAGGTITALKAGETTVKATVGGKVASCAVTVKPTPVEQITLSGANLELAALTGTAELSVTLSPANYTPKSIVWSSSVEAVATVEQDDSDAKKATVTANDDGTTGATLITVTVTDQADHVFTASCAVTVKPSAASAITLKYNGAAAPASGLALNLYDSNSAELAAAVTPATATDKTVAWHSTNESVVTVREKDNTPGTAVVTAAGVGSAKIVASTANGAVVAECAVTVTSTRLSGVKLDQNTLSFTLNGENDTKTGTLAAAVSPAGAAGVTVTWSSSDASVASVSGGTVTAKKGGAAVITATATDTDSRTYSASCAVTVRMPVTSVTLTGDAQRLVTDGATGRRTLLLEQESGSPATETIDLGATVSPAGAEKPDVIWYSSNPAVAEVDAETGEVSAVSPGTAAITVIAKDGGLSDSCTVTVRKAIRSITLNKTALAMTAGDTEALSAAVDPAGADQGIVWEVSPASAKDTIVSVSGSGVVSALAATGEGESVTVTARSAVNGDVFAACRVTVAAAVVHVSGVTLDQTALTLKKTESTAESTKLKASVAPSGATTKDVVWSVTDGTVAALEKDEDGNVKLDENGCVTVTAVNPGVTTVTVRTEDMGYTAVCTVTVPGMAVSGLSLDRSTLALSVEETAELTATVAPSSAVNKAVIWTSSAPTVALVDGTGKVYARSAGTAVITAASAANGDLKDTCTVTVTTGVTSITLNRTELALDVNGDGATLTAETWPAAAAADKKELEWTSSSAAVTLTKTDNNNYVVKAVRASTDAVTITVKTTDTASSAEAVCTVTVRQTVSGVSLTPAALERMKVGETKTLAVTVAPAAATNPAFEYSSSADTVAGVARTADGKLSVTALSPGAATILVATQDGGKTAACVVTVDSSIQLNKTSASLVAGNTETLVATVNPAGDALTWYSSDTGTATVDQNGRVSALKAGTATITALTSDGTASASCEVTVTAVAPTPVSSVALNKTALALDTGGSEHLRAAINPDGTGETVDWSSSNSAVAAVDATGLVTAAASLPAGSASPATAVITATAGGKTATCTVTVSQPVEEITLSSAHMSADKKLSLGKDGTEQLSVTFDPANASDKTLTWYSSNVSVATVSSAGLVTAVNGGTATIVASTKDGGYSDSCAVTVTVPVERITLQPDAVTMNAGQTKGLAVAVSPANADNRNVTWSSDDESVATVINGVVTAKGVGSATITATSAADSTVAGTCAVTVQSIPVVNISLDTPSKELKVHESATLTAAVQPSDATVGDVTWSSSDSAVAAVSGTGSTVTINALSEGQAIITATSAANHTLKAYCNVTVKPISVTGIDLDKTSVAETGTVTLTATLTAPADATNKKVQWYSSNTSVAEVADSAAVDAADGTSQMSVNVKAEGKAVIIVTTLDGGYTATCTVDVPFSVQSVSLNREAMALTIGDTETLKAVVTPSGAETTVTWKIKDGTNAPDEVGEDVIQLTNGTVKALHSGTVTVVAETANHKTAECVVTVNKPASSGVKLFSGSSEAAALPTAGNTFASGGSTIALTAKVEPATADQTVTWSSSDESVATVANGVVTPVKAGAAIIFAKAADGRVGSCTVTVSSSVTGVTLYKSGDESKTPVTALELATNGTAPRLAAEVATGGTVKTVTWDSTDKSVATVNSSGEITIRAAGSATIVAVAEDGGKEMGACKLTVWDSAGSVTLNKSSLVLAKNDKQVLLAAVNAATAGGKANPAVTWSSSDDSTVKVSQDGELTALRPGTVTIRAVDAGETVDPAECTVTVLEYTLSEAVDPVEMTISTEANGHKTIRLSAAAGDTIMYYFSTDQSTDEETGEPVAGTAGNPLTYSGPITVSEDVILKAYAVRDGVLHGATVTGVITVGADTTRTVFTDALGNSIDAASEVGSGTSLTANVTLSESVATQAANIFLAIYDTDGVMIKLIRYDMSSSDVFTQSVDLSGTEGKQIGRIKLMVLSADNTAVTASTNLGGA